jgi:hypothetical protein
MNENKNTHGTVIIAVIAVVGWVGCNLLNNSLDFNKVILIYNLDVHRFLKWGVKKQNSN